MSEENKSEKVIINRKTATVTQRKNLQEQAHSALTRQMVEVKQETQRHRVAATTKLARDFGADKLQRKVYKAVEQIDAIRESRDEIRTVLEAKITKLKDEIAVNHLVHEKKITPRQVKLEDLRKPLTEMGFHVDHAWKNAPFDPTTVCLREGQLPPQQFEITHCTPAGLKLSGLMADDTDRFANLQDIEPMIDAICWDEPTSADILAKLKAAGVEMP